MFGSDEEDYLAHANKNIEKLAVDMGAPFKCISAQGGLPLGVLSDMASEHRGYVTDVRLRIFAPSWEAADKIDTYLRDTLGLVSCKEQPDSPLGFAVKKLPEVDYLRHGGGMRGGLCYFDFYAPSLVEKLEALASAPQETRSWASIVGQGAAKSEDLATPSATHAEDALKSKGTGREID